jgi:hypothetical protein
MLVVDASIAFPACLIADGWSVFGTEELAAPPLLRSGAPVRLVPLANQRAAWDVAEALGWAKTYDAEYVALARALNCRLVTLDARMRRGAARLAEIIDAHFAPSYTDMARELRALGYQIRQDIPIE